MIADLMNKYATPKNTALGGGIISASLIAGAHAFERIGGLAPCPLCLDQREVHWTALAVFVSGAVIFFFTKLDKVVTFTLSAMAMVFAYSTWLAGYHAGVEWKFWEGPPTCSGAGQMIGDISSILDGAANGPVVSCTDAAWRMFGLSMAGYNALISLALCLVLAWVALQDWKQKS